jgi:hypothetical protein
MARAVACAAPPQHSSADLLSFRIFIPDPFLEVCFRITIYICTVLRVVAGAGRTPPEQVFTFIDLAGHERYIKTTVSGMTGPCSGVRSVNVRTRGRDSDQESGGETCRRCWHGGASPTLPPGAFFFAL